MNRFSLSFVDGALEAEYLDARATESRQQFVIANAVGIGVILTVNWMDRAVVGGDTAWRIAAVRSAMTIPGFMAGLLLALGARRVTFRRWWQVVGATSGTVTLSSAVAILVVASSAISRNGAPLYFHILTAYCVAVVALHTLWGVRFVFATAATVTTSLAVAAWSFSELRSSLAFYCAGWLGSINGGAMCASYLVERLQRTSFLERRNTARERARSEALLRNMLPDAIADRLKVDPSHIADAFADVTILFADIVGFTDLSARLSPAEVVAMLNRLFTAFDGLAEKYGLEKIKTIGDAYMVVGGLPEPRDDHAEAVAEMALAMREAVARVAEETGHPLKVRIGLNSGPVVAGVIGKKKFAYDLWGDAVNTASRMESHGLVGEIQISESTFERVKERFEVEARGAIAVKGKGELSTWLLRGKRVADEVAA